jgi:hypothetical protein
MKLLLEVAQLSAALRLLCGRITNWQRSWERKIWEHPSGYQAKGHTAEPQLGTIPAPLTEPLAHSWRVLPRDSHGSLPTTPWEKLCHHLLPVRGSTVILPCLHLQNTTWY